MKKIMTILVIILVDVLCADIDVGAHVAIAPGVILGIAALAQQMLSQAKAGQDQRSAATAAAAGQGGADKGGFEMTPQFQKVLEEFGKKTDGNSTSMERPPLFADQATADSVGSKIRQAQATADATGKVPVDSPIMGGAGIEKIDTPDLTEGIRIPEKEGFFGDMSKADKLAMAAQLGSMLRGPGAPPPPSAGGGGVRGIDMQPAFTNVTLRQLYGGR